MEQKTAQDIIKELEHPLTNNLTYPPNLMFSLGYLSEAIITGVITYFHTTRDEAEKVYKYFGQQCLDESVKASRSNIQ